jgi:hypothetical protein
MRVICALTVCVMLVSSGGNAWPTALLAAPPQQESPDAAAAPENLILSYAAKFVCTQPLQPGTFFYGRNAPLVQQETQVLIHNPNGFPVTLFKKAVIAPVEDPNKPEQGVAPGKWRRVTLAPDYAFHVDCDDIAKLLTGNAAATFLGTYGVGKTVEGFVVVGVGPQAVAGTNVRRFAQLDVTADYSRSAEFLKKDIHYQPWWRYWWWNLPWRLAYPYQRILPIDPATNIDCRGDLYKALGADVQRVMPAGPERNATSAALQVGLGMDPASPATLGTTSQPAQPALVALIGRCDKVTTTSMSVDYLLVSNMGSTDPNPLTGGAAEASAVRYPWVPGRWYDLALVTPQNLDVDIQQHFSNHVANSWVAAGGVATNVQSAMSYWFPYWCGWGYWYWWWNAGDCVDIAVGEAESLDVESVSPVRVFQPLWPPATQ